MKTLDKNFQKEKRLEYVKDWFKNNPRDRPLPPFSREALYSAAIDRWGVKAQVGMFVEEAGEALVAMNKMDRNTNGGTVAQFIEELADLSIMIEQMRVIFDPDDMFVEMKNKKLIRLAERLLK